MDGREWFPGVSRVAERWMGGPDQTAEPGSSFEVPTPQPSFVVGPPGWSWPITGAEETPRASYLIRVATGLLWRFALVGSVVLGTLISAAVPLVVVVTLLGGSQLVAVGRGCAAWAALWRAGLVALALAVSLELSVFPTVVVAGLAWIGTEPWIVAGRPWGPRFARLGSRLLPWSRASDDAGWSLGAVADRVAAQEGWR
jgi:hypothetical protein